MELKHRLEQMAVSGGADYFGIAYTQAGRRIAGIVSIGDISSKEPFNILPIKTAFENVRFFYLLV